MTPSYAGFAKLYNRRYCLVSDHRLCSETLAVLHDSSHIGEGDKLLTDLAGVIKENFDQS